MAKTKAIPDITWEHCSRMDPDNNRRVKCNYCKKIMFGGVNRMKNHIAGTKNQVVPCTVVDEHTKQLFQNLLTAFEEKKAKARDQECCEIDNNEGKDRCLVSFDKKRTQETMNQALMNREPAQSVGYDENLVGSRIKIWSPADKTYYPGVVKSFNRRKKEHKVLYVDDGEEELLDLKTEKWELVENVSPKSDCLKLPLPEKVSSPQADIICVQGYMVKNNIATVLGAIFKKYGDIASDCVFKPASVRATFLEVVCEVVQRIETSSFTTIVSEMEEIESQLSALEGAKINVSWLRAYLEPIYKRKKAKKNSILLVETKGTTVLVKRAAQMDLKERCAELVDAQERFVKAERCVRVLDLVEKKLSDNISELKAEKDSWAKQPILMPPFLRMG